MAEKIRKTIIELSDDEVELFLFWRKYQNVWERLFNKDFTGSLTIHIRQGQPLKNEWRSLEELSPSS